MMKKPGIAKEDLLDALGEKIPDPLRYQYFDLSSEQAATFYIGTEKGTLRTVAERIVRALKAPIEAFLRWWRRVRSR